MLIETSKWKLEINIDNHPISPRVDDDGIVSRMVCFNRSHTLGDTHGYKQSDYSSWDELKEDIKRKENIAIILPLYIYI